MALKVYLVGGTGNLGHRIAHSLLNKGLEVKLLVRNETLSKKKEIIDGLEKKGALIEKGEFLSKSDLDFLKSSMAGSHTVVSVINGGKDVTLNGQLNLLEAAIAVGAKRFLPSDFAVDLFNLDYGDNYKLDDKKRFNEILDSSPKIKAIHIQSGSMMESLFTPRMGICNLQTNQCLFYGDGNQKCDFTTFADTATFTAEIISDPEKNGIFEIVGEELSFNEVVASVSRALGKTIQPIQRGTVEELKKMIDESIQKENNPMAILPNGNITVAAQYHWAQVSGKGKLRHIVDTKSLWPHIKPTNLEDYARQNLRTNG